MLVAEDGSKYMPTAGTLLVASISPNFTGSLANLQLRHVEIDADDDTTADASDGCTTTLTSVTFDEPDMPGLDPDSRSRARAR